MIGDHPRGGSRPFAQDSAHKLARKVEASRNDPERLRRIHDELSRRASTRARELSGRIEELLNELDGEEDS